MTRFTFLLLFSLATVAWGQQGQLFSINADTVQMEESSGVIHYRGSARVTVLGLEVEADEVSIFGMNEELPQRIEADGSPIRFQYQGGGDELNGTARRVVFSIAELKLTLMDYSISNPSGHTMKGKEGSFILTP